MNEYTLDELIELRGEFEQQDPDMLLSNAPDDVQSYVCYLIDVHAQDEDEREEMLSKTIGELAPFVEQFAHLESYEDIYDLDEDFWDSYDPM